MSHAVRLIITICILGAILVLLLSLSKPDCLQKIWNDRIISSTRIATLLPWKSMPKGSTQNNAVIIEPRKDARLEHVICNVMFYLGSGWGLTIVHGTTNKEWLEEIIQRNNWKNIELLSCNQSDLPLHAYNHYLMSASFWHSLSGEHILIFQTDVLLRFHGIQKFLQYDYVGAPWLNDPRMFGNGGLSLRSRSKMLEVLKQFPPTQLDRKNNEDEYFSNYIRQITPKANVPTIEIASEFSSETIYNPQSIGVHALFKYHNQQTIDRFFKDISYLRT